MPATQTIRFRDVAAADDVFLRALYASTREQEMALLPWSDEQKTSFLSWQFDAQTKHYAEAYGRAEFRIIEQDGRPIGRLYLDRQPGDVRIVDIALVPDVRGQGIGTLILNGILEEGARERMPVSIHVEHFNPALRLYERLGFRHVDTNGVYHLMKWTPEGGVIR